MRWYKYLKNNGDENKGPALLDYENFTETNLIICQKLQYLYFGLFNNYLDFVKYMLKNTPENEKCYYETIFGNSPQRPYFDIEFYIPSGEIVKDGSLILPESEADESVECLRNCVLEELQELGKSFRSENILKYNNTHILVFTSHNKNKRSYHMVVEGFCVSNYKENKEFHDRVIKRMPDEWKNIIDHGMYKSLQQFRIAGNTKWESNRYKILNEKLTLNYMNTKGWIPKIEPDDENHKMVLLLEASLISQTSGCIMLICRPDEKKSYYNSCDTNIEGFNPLTPDEIKEALALCYKYANLEFGDIRFPYTYLRTVEDNGISSIILLKRLRASTCAICDRIHEHENPYLIVSGPEREVYLDCRRNSENKKLFVGKLGIKPSSPKIENIESNQKITKKYIDFKPPEPGFDVKSFIQNSSKNTKSVLPDIQEIKTKTLSFKIY
jgi:hypothetical protein